MTSLPPDTDRLTFRHLTMDDLVDLRVIYTDPVAMRHWPGLKNDAELVEGIQRCLNEYEQHGHGRWAVCLKGSGVFIGTCGILHQELRAQSDKEIGYSFQRHYWGRGYATEAARGAKDAAFRIFGFPYVVWYIGPANQPSINVALRNGMTLEEILPAEENKWKLTLHVYSVRRP